MTTKVADLSAADLDLRFTNRDDLVVSFLFTSSIAGFGGWSATARPTPENGSGFAFSVDLSQVGSNIVTIAMPSAMASQIETGWRWALGISTPGLRTLIAGRLEVERAAFIP